MSNKDSTPWLVQKYGGTSVGKFAVKIAKDIVSTYINDYKVAIVCSARSGSTKALGTTNLLLRASSDALTRPAKSNGTLGGGAITPITQSLLSMSLGHSRSSSCGTSSPQSPPSTSEPEFYKTVDLLRDEHIFAARSSIRDPAILQELEDEIERDCEWLRNFLFAAKIIDEISPRSRDNIVGLGERLACKIMTCVLKDQGIDAEYISLEDIVPPSASDDLDTSTSTLTQSFYDHIAAAMGDRISQCTARVPVITGFFGPVPGSLLRQIGRGYTDLASALLAVGLNASELQIWKEVDGIFTADPRKVSTARLIPMISPDEAAELTYYGSEVVHPFTMEQVIRRKIPIRIKNVENPKGGGTVIHPDPELALGGLNGVVDIPKEPTSPKSPHDHSLAAANEERRRLPTAVTIKEKIIVLNVNSNRKSVSHGFLARTFGTLDRFGVVVDLISTSEVHVSLAIEDGPGKKVLDQLVAELRKSGTVSIHRDMAILSLVGKQMPNMVGIAGRMFQTLAQGNVNIEMISQGASEINISCVIKGREAVKALNLIHLNCLQIKPEGARGRVGPWLF